ncbi:MAG TPA: NADH-ubiquinone oxidoreductase-F iron-sulfur binding region domain-containing protein [Candidatus Limnocylindrales bacterium]
MTTFLATPSAWPTILLGRTKALAANPWDLDAAVRAGAFDGLKAAVRTGATGTIAEVGASGLRGRGGAGYPTGDKWRFAASNAADQRYVIANGYGADPATQIDAALLGADPWSVIEGLVIAAFAVGATEAFLIVRGDDTALVGRLEAAVADAEEAGFVGEDVAGSGHRVHVAVRGLQGSYMLGEETVLIRALEGRRAAPNQRPPYPTERGLWERPTVVNSVVTLAAIPWILKNGAPAFAAIGTPDAPGTALVQLRGPGGAGIAEIPLGTPLREIAGLVGGTGARALKALIVGGPTGGFLPADALDTPYTFAALRDAGAHIGSGSIVIADDRACVVDLARLLTRFSADQACGKSIPCRIGLRRMSEIAERATAGTTRAGDAQLAADLAHDIEASALCDHERTATFALASVLRYFRTELDDHLLRSSCPAGVCTPIAVAGGAASRGASA